MARAGILAVAVSVGISAAPAHASAQRSPAESPTPVPRGQETPVSVAARLSPPPRSPMLVPRVRVPPASIDDAIPARSFVPQERDRTGVPYMVAGAALFVAGAIIGDDAGTLFMVGGAGVGAYGAFVYFGGEL